jgi:hypothetical protein
MNQTTRRITELFLSGSPKTIANSRTDGKALFLFNNKIAEHRDDGLYITNAGWFSLTTKERLNGLPDVSIRQSKKKWYLNGNEWDGSWIKVNDNPPPQVDESKAKNIFNMEKKYTSTDGWRGYESYVYAVAKANDTGMESDSPCRSDVAEMELTMVMNALKKKKIPHKRAVTETSNVFCIHHNVIVPPHYFEDAKAIVNDILQNTQTDLLYSPN